MKSIDLTHFISIKQVQEQYHLQGYQLVDQSVGYDDHIYLLFDQSSLQSNTKTITYTVVQIAMDWGNMTVESTQLLFTKKLDNNFHFVQPIGQEILLLNARCHLYRNKTAENNAVIVDRLGNIVREMCLGDGIENCIVTDDARIITSYFDEGVFGNYGWGNVDSEEPIGSCGLIVWNQYGEIIWKNEHYDICDCYAMNIDSKQNFWFYYYTDFELIKTDFKTDIRFSPQVSGAHGFLINPQQTAILFSGGYQESCFYEYQIGKEGLENQIKCDILLSGSSSKTTGYHFRSSKLLILNEQQRLYYFDYQTGESVAQ